MNGKLKISLIQFWAFRKRIAMTNALTVLYSSQDKRFFLVHSVDKNAVNISKQWKKNSAKQQTVKRKCIYFAAAHIYVYTIWNKEWICKKHTKINVEYFDFRLHLFNCRQQTIHIFEYSFTFIIVATWFVTRWKLCKVFSLFLVCLFLGLTLLSMILLYRSVIFSI